MSDTRQIRIEQSKGCDLYHPCPICYSCMNKAAHLYSRCANCEVPHDNHDNKKRNMLIRRENFAITPSEETAKKLKEWTDNRSN